MSCGCAERREKIKAALEKATAAAKSTADTAIRLYEVLGGAKSKREEEHVPKA